MRVTRTLFLAALVAGAGALLACDDGNTVEDLPPVELPKDGGSADETDGEAAEEEPPPADPQTPEEFAAVAEKEVTAENAKEVADALAKELEAELAELQ